MSILALPHKAGIGLRQQHWQDMCDTRPAVGFLEIHAENFLGDIGRSECENLRRDYPFSLHAVGLSLASADGIDTKHLDRVAELAVWLQPLFISDHLCWSSLGGKYFNDLMPFPFTEESLQIVGDNILKAQERFERPLLIENISAYLQFRDSAIPEAEFMAALIRYTGCGILCDVNNAYVNQINHGVDALTWMRALPAEAVREIHLAGHHVNKVEGGEILIDDHGSRVIEPVWNLYTESVKLFPHAVTLIEWDTNIPALEVLVDEAQKADAIRAGGIDARAA